MRAVVNPDHVSGCSRDVMSGTYEGGAKVWEATEDVMAFLLSSAAPVNLRTSMVLDLGCGAGLLACFASKHGARQIVCQDLNAEVLREVTARNLLLNGACAAGAAPGAPTLVASSWASLLGLLKAGADVGSSSPLRDLRAALVQSCDAVLSSEILYREESYVAIVGLLEACLAKPHGKAVVGSKRYYYGAELGGGSLAFVDFVNRLTSTSEGDAPGSAAPDLRLRAKVAHSVEDWRSMTRDVVVVYWQRP